VYEAISTLRLPSFDDSTSYIEEIATLVMIADVE
jgi:hypothetical protein